MTSLKAFNGDPNQKANRLAQAEQHIQLDMLRTGTYGDLSYMKGKAYIWDDISPKELKTKVFKACSLGCYYGAVSPHQNCESIDSIPLEVAVLADDLFEALLLERRIQWHKEWIEAIPVGANLSRVWHQYDYWIVHDPKDGVISFANDTDKALINKYKHLLFSAAYGDMPSGKDFNEAVEATWKEVTEVTEVAGEAWEAQIAAVILPVAGEAWKARIAGVLRAVEVGKARWEARRTLVGGAAMMAREIADNAEKQADRLLVLLSETKNS